jgi:hypothetical protein
MSTVTVILFPSVHINPIPTGAGGIVRGTTITVSGTANCQREIINSPPVPGDDEPTDTIEPAPEAISGVAVRLGTSGPFVQAKPSGPAQTPWTSWTTDPLPITGFSGDSLTITARVTAGTFHDEAAVTVTVDRTPPNLALTTPDEMTQTLQNNVAIFEVQGTASDEKSAVVAVEWALDQDTQFKPAHATGPNGAADWSKWTTGADVKLTAPGTNYLCIRARDAEQNVTPPKQVTLHAVQGFQPHDPDDVFGPADYLDDLLTFATQRVAVDAAKPTPTALDRPRLGATFFQRFDALTAQSNQDVATQQVRQIRVCVEVLRRYLAAVGKGVSPAEEADYRQQAYAALLRHLGTSPEEVRRVRGDASARAALAGRLGVDRPDRLDALPITPDQITEAKLEQIFGLTDTNRDVLASRAPAQPLLLTWQQARLTAQWKAQDDAARVFGDVVVPVVEPDLLSPDDFARPRPGDTAYDLWTSRQQVMNDDLKAIDAARKGQPTPLQGFDTIVGPDIVALLGHAVLGENVSAALSAVRLTPLALQYLLRARELARTSAITDTDWADVYAIVAQVHKIRRYPAWRAEEQRPEVGILLSPDYFTVPDATAAPASLPDWRATPQDRRAWQETLRARISERQALVDALHAVLDAAEEEALPGLRDALVAAALQISGDDLKRAGQPPVRGLLIDLSASPVVRTTRTQQAIETLQGVLFAVRTGSFAQCTVPTSSGPFAHPASAWRLMPAMAIFDADWQWWGSHETWRAAARILAHPESHLLPTLRPDPGTSAWQTLVADLRSTAVLTPSAARQIAATYLNSVRTQISLPSGASFPVGLVLTDQLTDTDLGKRKADCATLFSQLKVVDPHQAPDWVKEIFFYVPLLIGLQLQRSGEFLAAIDWFKTVYAYHLPLTLRKIYNGLTMEESIDSKFPRPVDESLPTLNPFDVARFRNRALTRFVVFSLVRCFATFADAEFTRETPESVARARALYETALDLFDVEFTTAGGSSPDKVNPYGPDPVVEALRAHIETNLRKLHLGRNIAGLERDFTRSDQTAIAPRQPTPYRYTTLIARAKELAQLAAQFEVALLAALEKRDAEAYTLLKAGQDVELATQNVALQGLRLTEATDGVTLATLQQARAQIQVDHFQELLSPNLNDVWEALGVIGAVVGAVAGGFAKGSRAAGIVSGIATGAGILFGEIASFERRQDDWQFQLALAQQDVLIAGQQVALAQDQVAVARQEQQIAQLQATHAAATVEFLARKFTSVELYEFMSGVLVEIYRSLLQRATATARLAQDQLAFERQVPALSIIRGDYWEVSPDNVAAAAGTPDRSGLTGSARLLGDIVDLDQQAFLTERRRLQLTKTISLAQLAPVELQQFRQTGVLVFGTPAALFDRDFPGHYRRLIKRVRVSVVALIPPVEGIRATLSTPGTSRTVIGGDTFRIVTVRRDPETIALSSPKDATGLFELIPDTDPELLLPFEGSGVDTIWRLELPKAANQFDYTTIGDVLFTLEYEALHSSSYRQQVIRRLAPRLSLDRPFSFRQAFPDQWYDLHNPDQTATPMTVRFTTSRADFPPNLDDLTMQQIVLYFARADEEAFEVPVEQFRFTEAFTGARLPDAGQASGAVSLDGIISTRRGNAPNWASMIGKRPIGEWELVLPNTEEMQSRFHNEQIGDILFVITYTGRTPAWPV